MTRCSDDTSASAPDWLWARAFLDPTRSLTGVQSVQTLDWWLGSARPPSVAASIVNSVVRSECETPLIRRAIHILLLGG